jgi:hypothetical protein
VVRSGIGLGDGADVSVKQSGHAILTVKPKVGGAEEKYLITLRKFRLDASLLF